MSNFSFAEIDTCFKSLKLDISSAELAIYAEDNSLSIDQLEAFKGLIDYLKESSDHY